MKTYYFKNANGPTEINLSQAFDSLGWQKDSQQAQFNQDSLINDQLLEVFEHKHKLYYWLSKHCPEIAPQTVVIDELFLHQALEKLKNNNNDNKIWILKPALLNNGQGIKIFNNIENIKEYFTQNNRYSGLFVLQEYINKPKLINKKKFSLRMFVILNSDNQAFLYPKGYLNICQKEYDNTKFVLDAHLTNEYLNTDGLKNNEQRITDLWPDFKKNLPSIVSQCKKIFLPWFSDNTLKINGYAVLGVDFMIDENNTLWLIEINHGACFPVNNEHPLFDCLYKPLWNALVSEVIEKNLNNNTFIHLT